MHGESEKTNAYIHVMGAEQHNLQDISVRIPKNKITVITGVSGSGKSTLAYDVLLGEANRLFLATLSNYSRQFLDLSAKAKVGKISGLSPAIGLTQRETRPSSRSHIAGFTDIGELLGVLFAHYSLKYCPQHNLPTVAESLEERTQHILQDFLGKIVAIMVPLVTAKTGAFSELMMKYAQKGFSRVWINGSVQSLIPIPQIDKNRKNTIKLLVDGIKVNQNNEARIHRGLSTALKEGKGFAEYAVIQDAKDFVFENSTQISSLGGCPICRYSWPKLDSRYFSSNSLGRCRHCEGLGSLDLSEEESYEGMVWHQPCSYCQGTGLGEFSFFARHQNLSVADIYKKNADELSVFFQNLASSPSISDSQKTLYSEIETRLTRLKQLGLGTLGLMRRLHSLSYGELQRLRLAQILATDLCGVLYVIDEPSQGLHGEELGVLLQVFSGLKKRGNTLVLIEHELAIISQADWIIDLGPEGGSKGGRVVAEFAPFEAKKFAHLSLTAKHLSMFKESMSLDRKKSPREYSCKENGSPQRYLELIEPRLFNLKMPKVRFLLHHINLVTGYSGSGKNSLVLHVLAQNIHRQLQTEKRASSEPMNCTGMNGHEGITSLRIIDRLPVGKTFQSIPMTYLEIMNDIRSLFLATPEAQILGLNSRDLSFQGGEGRCPECKGRGTIVRKVKFLADAEVLCLSCNGKRFSDRVLQVRYQGRTFYDVLEMSLEEARDAFKNHRKINHRLSVACDIGLGYLKMGQPTSTYSGGEAQRIKLAAGLGKRTFDENSLIIISEPSLGLHNADIEKLNSVLGSLQSKGATLVIVDNHDAFVPLADWCLQLGPRSGPNGGDLVYEGLMENWNK